MFTVQFSLQDKLKFVLNIFFFKKRKFETKIKKKIVFEHTTQLSLPTTHKVLKVDMFFKSFYSH